MANHELELMVFNKVEEIHSEINKHNMSYETFHQEENLLLRKACMHFLIHSYAISIPYKENAMEVAVMIACTEKERRHLKMTNTKQQGLEQQQQHPSPDEMEEEMTRSALSAFRAREEAIERRKREVREKVEAQLGRAEEETKRLAEIREELEAFTDPMRKDLAILQKKIGIANRDIKPLALNCQRKEKEYKEALDLFSERSRERSQLIAKLVELVTESEKMRMMKLEELNKNI